jgi:hypothetical protein
MTNLGSDVQVSELMGVEKEKNSGIAGSRPREAFNRNVLPCRYGAGNRQRRGALGDSNVLSLNPAPHTDLREPVRRRGRRSSFARGGENWARTVANRPARFEQTGLL